MQRFARSFGAGFALVFLGFIAAYAAAIPLPAVNGPYLGDQLNNLYVVSQAYIAGSGHGAGSAMSVSQTSGQANCTATGKANMMHTIGTSASTGYICLPNALSGRLVMYFNATGQTVDVYGANGTTDTINTTAGSTAYTSLVTHVSLICFAYKDGAWGCGVIS